MTDNNMDQNNHNFNNNYKITNIKDITYTFLLNNNYTTHNQTNTYFINLNQTKAPITTPKLVCTRQKHLLTEHTLKQYLTNNEILLTAYNYTDPDLIAEIIMTEYNNVIDKYARTIHPTKTKNLDYKNNNYTNYT